MQDTHPKVETPAKDTSTWAQDGRFWEAMCRPAASSKAAEPQSGHRSVESIVAAARAAAGARVLPDAEWKDDQGVTHRRENGQESITLEKVEPWVPSVGSVVRFQAGYLNDVGEVIAYENGHVCVDAGHGADPDDVYRVPVNCVREATTEEFSAFRSYSAPAKTEPDGATSGGMRREPVPASEGYAAGGQPPAKAPLAAEDAAAYADDYAFLRGEFAALAEERSAVAATLEGAAARLAGIQQALDVFGPVLEDLKAKVSGA